MAVVVDEVVGEVGRPEHEGQQRPAQEPRQEPPDVAAMRVILGRVMRRQARTQAD